METEYATGTGVQDTRHLIPAVTDAQTTENVMPATTEAREIGRAHV